MDSDRTVTVPMVVMGVVVVEEVLENRLAVVLAMTVVTFVWVPVAKREPCRLDWGGTKRVESESDCFDCSTGVAVCYSISDFGWANESFAANSTMTTKTTRTWA